MTRRFKQTETCGERSPEQVYRVARQCRTIGKIPKDWVKKHLANW